MDVFIAPCSWLWLWCGLLSLTLASVAPHQEPGIRNSTKPFLRFVDFGQGVLISAAEMKFQKGLNCSMEGNATCSSPPLPVVRCIQLTRSKLKLVAESLTVTLSGFYLFYFLTFILISCVWMFHMLVCVCTAMCSVLKSQKRALDPLGLQL